ncbi:glycosyltransferase [Marinobacterium zhoushanense]|nr:glycosyltransferase [Marinobacterium zhoushanense]
MEVALSQSRFDVCHYAFRESLIRGLKGLLLSEYYILATWKMLFFVVPFVVLKKSKFLVVLHGNELLNLGWLSVKIIKYIAKNKRFKFVANSKAIAAIFEDLSGHKVDFIQYPFGEFEGRGYQDINRGDLKLVTVSRLVPRKNVENVIRALALLKKDGVNFSYDIIGEGPCFHSIMKLVKSNGLDKNVYLHGFVDDTTKNSILNGSDYFILPSLFDSEAGSIEGFGIVYLEANYFGLPVLSGNTGGITEAVVDGVTGLHCDGSVQHILEKLKELFDTKFDKEYLVQYAERFDYRKQNGFIGFLKGWFHE